MSDRHCIIACLLAGSEQINDCPTLNIPGSLDFQPLCISYMNSPRDLLWDYEARMLL